MDISAEIAAIQAASQGSELRQPLVGALNKLNSGTLPAVTASDVGKILKVGANGWEVGEKSGYMPVPVAEKQITSNGTYDVTDYASANVNVSGGSSLQIINPFGSSITFVSPNGVTITSQSVVDGIGSVTVSESQAGYEGFNIKLDNLTANNKYVFQFTIQKISGNWYNNSLYAYNAYICGFKISDSVVTDYSILTGWENNIIRDNNAHTYAILFDATALSMYFNVNLCGLSDGETNQMSFTNMTLWQL